MTKFGIGAGENRPKTLKNWAEMIADRFGATGITIKEEDKEETIDVLRKSLEEFRSALITELEEEK